MNVTKKADRQPSMVQVATLRIDRGRFDVKIREHEVYLSRIAIPRIHPVDAPISAKATALMPTIGPHHPHHLARDGRAALLGRRPRGRAVPASPTTFRRAARGWAPTTGSATGAVISPMPRSAMVSTKGRGMLMGMADGKSIATPVRERVRHSVLTGVPSRVFTSRTCIAMWRRMKPWSIRNGSPLSWFNGCASVACECILATHEPRSFALESDVAISLTAALPVGADLHLRAGAPRCGGPNVRHLHGDPLGGGAMLYKRIMGMD